MNERIEILSPNYLRRITRKIVAIVTQRIVPTAMSVAAVLLVFRDNRIEIVAFSFGVGFLIVIAGYLGLFGEAEPTIRRQSDNYNDEVIDMIKYLRELRNYLVHFRSTANSSVSEFNIDEEFKNQILSRLVDESKDALSSFIDSEIFKISAERKFEKDKFEYLTHDIERIANAYHLEIGKWRKNANVNLLLGLFCAIAGIGLMYHALVYAPPPIEPGNNWGVDFFRFASRFGLVVIIESVAFFFLKLYREDRSMIRYFRNEVTNLEMKGTALKTALVFGTPADRSKVLQMLGATERNFVLKKDERVLTDVTQENSELLLEKLIGLLGRYGELANQGAKATHNNANGTDTSTHKHN